MTINIQRICRVYLASILILFISSSLILGQSMLNTAAGLTSLQEKVIGVKKPNSTSAPPNPPPLKLPEEVSPPSTQGTGSKPTNVPSAPPPSTQGTGSKPTNVPSVPPPSTRRTGSKPTNVPSVPPPSTQRTGSKPTISQSSSHNNKPSGALRKRLTVKQINFGVVEFGILARNDFQAEDRYFHLYQFKGNKNQPIQIKLVGSADKRTSNNLSLVPYLFLLDPMGQVIANTGSTEADRGILMFDRLPFNGTYTIAVTSKKPKDIGRYSLALKQDRTRYILDRSGELTNQSPTLKQDGSPFDVFELQAKQNQLVNIRFDSVNEQFYPYVCLVNTKGQIIAWNDTKNGNYSALIDRARLPKDDTYYIMVNSANPKGRGKYRLTVY